MTTPRDAISGLSGKPYRGSLTLIERLVESPLPSLNRICQDRFDAATQLDSLLKEREALQARVKELERERDLYAECSMKEEDCRKIWQARALRAEQERDEAYERAAKVADELEDRWSIEWRDGLKANTHIEGMSDGAGEVAAAIRRLAGPEKEGE